MKKAQVAFFGNTQTGFYSQVIKRGPEVGGPCQESRFEERYIFVKFTLIKQCYFYPCALTFDEEIVKAVLIGRM